MPLTLLAAIPLAIWIYLLLGRGSFWFAFQDKKLRTRSTIAGKSVVVIIPARNEAAVIADALTSLFEQDFSAPLHIVLVDDSSSDGTADAARAVAKRAGRTGNLTVLTGQPLPPGWCGYLCALAQGVAEASKRNPDYFLFTDADIRHDRRNVADLVSIADSLQADLASYMVKLRCETFAEKALIPAFVYFFLQLYPPSWVGSSKKRTAGAAGGCILIRPAKLAEIGGIAAIRGEVIDDCALARAVKRSGGRLWMGLTPATESIRRYGSFAEICAMISRSAFSQLKHSSLLLAATLLGLAVTYFLPVAFAVSGYVLGVCAWLMMSISYCPMLRFYRRSFLWSLALPLVALFYSAATLHSAVQFWRGKGGSWKGRVQDLPDA